MEIQFIRNEDIDKLKWNSCVHYANNGNVFGYKWFLDHVAKEWDGLIEGDYESVFPLVWRKNMFNRKELFQPHLMRELGLFSIHVLSRARLQNFLDAIPEEYKLIEIALNEQNQPVENNGFVLTKKANHQLTLNRSFEEIEQAYSQGLKQAIEEGEENGLLLTSSLKPETIADFYQKYTKDRTALSYNFHALQRIMYNALHRGWGFASGVTNSKNDLLAANFFIYSHGKVMSLIPVVSPEGEKQKALEFLFHMLIRGQANRPLILDFNTQKEDQLAIQFGANPNPFYHIRKDKRRWGVF